MIGFALLVAVGIQGSAGRIDASAVLLQFRHAQLGLQEARQQLEQAEQLFAEGIEPRSRLELARLAVERARVEHDLAVATALQIAPRLVVAAATKLQGSDGRLRLRVRVASLPTVDFSVTGKEFLASPLEPSVLLTVHNALVSIQNPQRTVVGLPYEARLPPLPPGREATLEFQLTEDVTTAVISLRYGGRTDDRAFHVQYEGDRPLRVECAQVSQEADLGSFASYDLRIERLAAWTRFVRLAVVGLPSAFRYEFLLDGQENANRLSQYRFPESESEKSFLLRVHLPETERDRGDASFRLDQPLPFRAVVLESSAPEAVVTAAATGRIAARYGDDVELEVTARGIGKIELRLPNYYMEATEGEAVELAPDVRNAGSRAVQDVKVSMDIPIGWMGSVDPPTLAALAPNEARQARILIVPGSSTVVGDYQIKLTARARSSGRELATETREVRVRISPRQGFGATIAVLLGLVSLLAGVVYAGTRLARR